MLFSTTAGAGHFGPMVPVAQACLAAGWEVAVAAPSGFGESVRTAGLEHLRFPEAPHDLMGQVFGRLLTMPPAEGDRVVMVEVFGRLDAQAALPGLITIMADWRPDLVLREPCEFGSLAAAEAAGIPQAQVAIGMARHSGAFIEMLEEPLAELSGRVGIRPGRLADRLAEIATLTSVPASLDASDRGLMGREFGHPVADDAAPVWRHRTIPSGSAVLPPAWGDQDLPLVYVSYGSVLANAGYSDTLFGDTLAALADQPIRVLMTTGSGLDLGSLGPIPANARVERWWPQADVMPAASAMIGHGGFGTTMLALAAGVPQVVVPLFAGDQHVHAAQVASVGAGLLTSAPELATELPAALDRILNEPGFADQARAIAAEIAILPDLDGCLPLLESLSER